MPQEATIVLIEDESEIRRFLKTTLPGHGFRVYDAATGQEGLIEIKARNPDLILLDLGLPDMDGTEVIRQVRAWTALPIIVLSARGNEADKIKALDGGADDYLTKPFSVGELMARIRVALRHVGEESNEADAFAVGDLRVDFRQRQVLVHGKEVRLTPIEYRLLSHLVANEGRVCTHRQILREVWGPGHAQDSQYLRVFMAALRRKLEADPAQPAHILTETGIGYRLRA